MRLGAEVIAVDRYAGAPAMHVAHRHHVMPMTDAAGLRALVEREAPDMIVPEIEQIATAELVRLEQEGWTVIPRAESTRATMDREKIRRLATEQARVKASAFRMVESADEARRAVEEVGLPAVFKAVMSSSGHGMSVVRDAGGAEAAYREASEHGRVRSPRVMVEEFIPFDREVTMLTLRHFDPGGQRRHVGHGANRPPPPGDALPRELAARAIPPGGLAFARVHRDGGHRPARRGRDLRGGMLCPGRHRVL